MYGMFSTRFSLILAEKRIKNKQPYYCLMTLPFGFQHLCQPFELDTCLGLFGPAHKWLFIGILK